MEKPPTSVPELISPKPSTSFLLPKTIGRLSYFGRIVALLVIHLVIGYLLQHSPLAPRIRLILIMAWVAVLLIYFYAFVIVPRLRDFGLPVLAVLLCFVPFLNVLVLIALLFGPQNYWQILRNRRA